MSKKPLVIYHDHCWDGFCAAWIFYKSFPEAEFLPANYGDEIPEVTGRDVYIVDFSYSRKVLEEMKSKAKSLLVLDHHKTAEENLKGLSYCKFDMTKSGGRLAWEHLRSDDNDVPWLVRYTEDRDLWRWNLSRSKEINAALHSYPLSFDLWDTWPLYLVPRHLVVEGEAIIRDQQNTVASKAKQSHEIEIEGFHGRAANATTLMSETSQELAKGFDFGLTWFEFPDGSRMYSLRSTKESGVDVSAIAKHFGGGGHLNAAGFKLLQGNPHPWIKSFTFASSAIHEL